MKKYLTALLIVVCAVFCSLGISACVPKGITGDHNWSSKWSADGDQHWHECQDPGCVGEKDRGNHELDELLELIEPATCYNEGEGVFRCSVCRKSIQTVIPATNDHDWELVTTYKAPTCGVAGEGRFSCNNCPAEATLPIEPTGDHKVGTAWAFNAEGHYHECSVCKQKFDFAEHAEGAPNTITPKDDYSEGKTEYRCKDCNRVMREDVERNPKLADDFRVKIEHSVSGKSQPVVSVDAEKNMSVTLWSEAVNDPAKRYTVSFTDVKDREGNAIGWNISTYVKAYWRHNDTNEEEELGTSGSGRVEIYWIMNAQKTAFTFSIRVAYDVETPKNNIYVIRMVLSRGDILVEKVLTITVVDYDMWDTVQTAGINAGIPLPADATVYYMDKKSFAA